MKSTIRKKGTTNKEKKKRAPNINMKKLQKFNYLWSIQTPRSEVMQKLDISKTTYYNYIDQAEEIADDFVMGMVDHGLVLQFRDSMSRMHKKVLKLDELSNTALVDIETNLKDGKPQLLAGLNNIIRNYLSAEKTYNLMLDDGKLVNQTMKTLNKVIVKHAQAGTGSGKR